MSLFIPSIPYLNHLVMSKKYNVCSIEQKNKLCTLLAVSLATIMTVWLI